MVAARRIEKSSLANDTIVAITAIPANMFTYSEMSGEADEACGDQRDVSEAEVERHGFDEARTHEHHDRDDDQEARDHERE